MLKMRKLQPLHLAKMCKAFQSLQCIWSRESSKSTFYRVQCNQSRLIHSTSFLLKSDSEKSDNCGSTKSPNKGQDESKSCVQLNAKNICSKDAPESSKSTPKNASKDNDSSKKQDENKTKVVTLIPGDGIGPEITEAVVKIFETAKAPIQWEVVCHYLEKDERGNLCRPNEMLDSFLKNKVALKGPIKGADFNWGRFMRREFGIFAFVSHARSLGKFQTVYKPIDVIVIRDCTEGEYTGIEHEVVPGVIQSIKVSTHYASKRLVDYAFAYAVKHKRKKITGAHKANIMRFTDGIILSVLRDDARKTLGKILFEERFLDTVCHRLVSDPDSFDVIVASSMYGDVVNMVTAGIAGGMEMIAAFMVAQNGIIYDCAHTTANNIAGKDEANPTSIILSSILMLRDLGFKEHADKIEDALTKIYCELKHLTKDLGGKAKLSEFTDEICKELCQ